MSADVAFDYVLKGLFAIISFLAIQTFSDFRKQLSAVRDTLKEAVESISKLNEKVAISIERDSFKDKMIGDLRDKIIKCEKEVERLRDSHHEIVKVHVTQIQLNKERIDQIKEGYGNDAN